jgi:2-phosphosulfolactate phosphatase
VIDVAFTGDGVSAADVAVVIDVLRATSTATQALAAGYRRVLCVGSVEGASQLRSPGRVLAGERQCVKPPGFDQGNSPRETLDRRGEELVLATTNGAPAIVAAAASAPTVLLACLLNLDAVVMELLRREDPQAADLQIVCSGTDGAVALEDVYVAGRVIARLRGPRTDAALVAEALPRAFPTPLEALAASADAAALRAAGLTSDIADCARESKLDVVPAVVSTSAGVAIVAPVERPSRARHSASTRGDLRARSRSMLQEYGPAGLTTSSRARF